MDPDAVLVQRQMQWCFDAINLVRSSAVQHRSYNLQTTAIIPCGREGVLTQLLTLNLSF